MNRWIDGETYILKNGHTDRLKKIGDADRWTDKQIEKIDRQIGKYTVQKIDRQIDRWKNR
jgi:hypothetical protein